VTDLQSTDIVNPDTLDVPGGLQQMYRLYNAEGDLLYIGISYSTLSRICQHHDDKTWWPAVTRVEIENFTLTSRATMRTIEREAIIRERPLYNISHAKSERPAHQYDWIARWRASGRICPSCGKDATYDYHLDRFFHADGSASRPCWITTLTRTEKFRGDW
jgi:hypothetical protein